MVLLLMAVMMLSSCLKEEVPPAAGQDPCNCGIVLENLTEYDNYYLVVRNKCTNNPWKFQLAYGDWVGHDPGDTVCFSGGARW